MPTGSTTEASVNTDSPLDVVVVGGGLAGLSCAATFCKSIDQSSGSIALLEATDRVGGRLRTEVVDGFTLDHGFQVLLTAYPACKRLLDYQALRLRPFEPGAIVRCQGKFTRLGDPWRRPAQALATAMSPVGTFADKLRVAKSRRESSRGSLEDLYQRENVPTIDRLRDQGYSEGMIDRFFRPFLGGVFLDETLVTSSRMLEFVLRMFAAGDIAVPADGMGSIARQLADSLPRGTIHLKTTVQGVELGDEVSVVQLTDGRRLRAKNLVVATESNAAARLLGCPALETEWNSATTLYYSAESSPHVTKMLTLRGDEEGPIQSSVVISDVAPEYGSRGRSLICVSTSDSAKELATEDLDQQVRQQFRTWYGEKTERWELVQTYRIPFGLPKQSLASVLQSVDGPQIENTLPEHVFVCGDHRETPSINGAMNSGIRVGEAVIGRTTVS